MVNLFDIMRQAHHGHAFEDLSRQFGMDLGQTQRAVEALLPAFSLGFLNSTRNPDLFAGFVRQLSSGRYAPFFDGAGPPPPGLHAGAAQIVGQLFGSPEAARQIANQASAMTGIGAQVMQKMLPVVGGTLMGGLFRYATADGVADALRQWSETLRNASNAVGSSTRPEPPRGAYQAWGEAMDRVWRTGYGAATPPPPPPPSRAESWSDLVGAMMPGAIMPGPKPAKAPEPAPASGAPAGAAATNPFDTLLRMFETGREVQAQHLATLQSILEGAWGAGTTR